MGIEQSKITINADVPKITLGESAHYITFDSGNAGIFLGYDSGSYKLRIGNTSTSTNKNRMTWDGTSLKVYNNSGNLILNNPSTSSTIIAGWTADSDGLYYNGGTEATSAGMLPGAYPFYAGASKINVNNAPFRVTPAGLLYATNAMITGTINASGGSITGTLTIGPNMKLGVNVYNTNTGIYINSYNYWYDTGNFKVGSSSNYLSWDTSNLNIVPNTFTLTTTTLIIDSSSAVIKLGNSASSITETANTGVYISGAGRFRAGSFSSGTLSAGIYWDGSTIQIKSTNFSVDVAGNVSLTGTINSSNGTIGSWKIGSSIYCGTNETTDPKIKLNPTLRRIGIFNGAEERVAMGYLENLPKNDGTGNWTSADYGFWVKTGDKLRIDGDGEYKNGDWLIQHNARYLVVNSSNKAIVKLGNRVDNNSSYGLYFFSTNGSPEQTDEAGELLAKYTDNMILIGKENGQYLKWYNGTLTVSGDITVLKHGAVNIYENYVTNQSSLILSTALWDLTNTPNPILTNTNSILKGIMIYGQSSSYHANKILSKEIFNKTTEPTFVCEFRLRGDAQTRIGFFDASTNNPIATFLFSSSTYIIYEYRYNSNLIQNNTTITMSGSDSDTNPRIYIAEISFKNNYVYFKLYNASDNSVAWSSSSGYLTDGTNYKIGFTNNLTSTTTALVVSKVTCNLPIKSTIISGDVIKTGAIQSNNYVDGSTGSYLDLTNGIFKLYGTSSNIIEINSNLGKIAIGNSTYGQTGIQLEYYSGYPRIFIGNSNQYIKYESSNNLLEIVGKLVTRNSSSIYERIEMYVESSPHLRMYKDQTTILAALEMSQSLYYFNYKISDNQRKTYTGPILYLKNGSIWSFITEATTNPNSDGNVAFSATYANETSASSKFFSGVNITPSAVSGYLNRSSYIFGIYLNLQCKGNAENYGILSRLEINDYYENRYNYGIYSVISGIGSSTSRTYAGYFGGDVYVSNSLRFDNDTIKHSSISSDYSYGINFYTSPSGVSQLLRMHIDANGYIGINSSANSSYRLYVNGNINGTDILKDGVTVARWRGSGSSLPSSNNSAGDLYFNIALGKLYIFDGSMWQECA